MITREEIRQKQLSGALPLDQLKGVPRTAVDLIKRMLEADPAKRPQSPAELKEQLNNCITATDTAKQKQRRRFAYSSLAAAALIIVGLGTSYILQREFVSSAASEVVPEKSIAVLPFQNLSGDPENAYFGNAIQEEILTRLSRIADLKVISRTSTQQYQSKPANLREIAKQLGVANILEGSVQKVADQVRVNVQLIHAQSDSHLWADTYDRKLTDIFGVETEIAKRIAESLQAKLTGREEQALAVKPTNNPEAYEAYLRGLAFDERNYFSSYSTDLAEKAVDFYERAVQLDPNFAVAWARLSRANAWISNSIYPTGAARKEAAKRGLDQAQKLAPDSPDTLLALANYQYMMLGDPGAATTTVERLSQMLPGSGEARMYLGIAAHNAGHWDQSIAYFEQALAMDPRNVQTLIQAAWTYTELRQFPAALKLYDRVLDITPHDADVMATKAAIYHAQGNLPEAARLLAGVNEQTPNDTTFSRKIAHLQYERDYGEAVRLLQARLAQFHYDVQYEKVNDQVTLALLQRLAGDAAGAKITAEQARNTLEPLYKNQRGNELVLQMLPLAYALMGEKNSALNEAERAIMLLPRAKDPVAGPALEENLALIQTIFDEKSRAISALTQLLQTPYSIPFFTPPIIVTQALLRLDPFWDPLRSDPAFQKLCEEKQP
jgi:TolB-like protein/Flp pilus assembly protein TadD